jgi:hypothetical protein
VFILFSLLILLWFFQSPVFMPGWADFFMKVFTLHFFLFSIYDLKGIYRKRLKVLLLFFFGSFPTPLP